MRHVDALGPHNTATCRHITTLQQPLGGNAKCHAVVRDSGVKIERPTEISSSDLQPLQLTHAHIRAKCTQSVNSRNQNSSNFYDNCGNCTPI